jgi:hypothetical protein
MKVLAVLLVLAAVACGSAEPPAPVTMSDIARLTPQAPETTLAVPPTSDGRMLVEITRVDNPELREVTLVVSFDVGNDTPQRFSLYPPDRGARIAVRVPEGAAKMQVRIESRESLPALVELRALPFPR